MTHGRGHCLTCFGGSCSRAGHPGMRRGSDVVAPPASHPVLSDPVWAAPAAFLPGHAGTGGHQELVLQEQTLPATPGPWRHSPPHARRPEVGAGTGCQGSDPGFQSFRIRDQKRPRTVSKLIPLTLGYAH